MADEYSGIEVTPEEGASLFTDDSVDSSTTEVTETDDQSGNTQTEVSDDINLDDYELMIGEDAFDMKSVMAWKDAHDNKTQWNQSNTQKAQDLAKVKGLVDQLRTDESFRNYVKDYYYDNQDIVNRLGLDSEYPKLDVADHEIPTPEEAVADFGDPRYDELNSRMEMIEEERAIEEVSLGFDSLANRSPLLRDEHSQLEFLDAAQTLKNQGVIDGTSEGLERAYKLWAYDKMEGQLNNYQKLDSNRERNKGVVVDREGGAKEVVQDTKYADIKEISMDDPAIAKYFNN